jgi:Carboxypeptidase regulatory-like domain
MTQFLIAFLLLAATADEPVVRGHLCIGERKGPMKECTSVTGRTFAVTAADRDRLFVWTNADGATAQVGVIPAKAESIDLGAGSLSNVRLTIAGDRSRGWPADVELTLGTREQQWTWTVAAKAVERLRTVVVPRADMYALTLKAERHRTMRRPVPARDEQSNLGEVRLAPFPVVRARVVDVDGKPIAAANVVRPDGAHCASANEQGVVVCEVADPPVEVVTVTAPGYSSEEIRVVREPADDRAPQTITLVSGRKLTVKVTRPEAGVARVSLFRESKLRHEPLKMKTIEIKEPEAEVGFDAGTGNYFVVVEGSDPLERLEVPVKIGDADVSETITIEPFRMIGSARFGEDAITDGKVYLTARGNTWTTTIPIKDGVFGGTLWQRTNLRGAVDSAQLGVIEPAEVPKLGDTDPSHWDIRIEKRMITGRVFDAATKQAVPRATMSLTAQTDGRKMYTSPKIGPDGTYRIVAKAGTYSIRVTSPDHVPFSTDVRVVAEDAIRTVDIALDPGVVQPLELVSATGAPVASAQIIEGIQPDRVNPEFMSRVDAQGRYAVRGQPGQSRLLYAVPQTGSFAVVRLVLPRSSADAKPLQVVVPPAAGSLRIRVVDGDGKPAPRLVLLRYNGEFLPYTIARFIDPEARTVGNEFVISRLPAGTYELWPLVRHDDEVAIITSGGTLRPPTRVGLAGGEQIVTLTLPR